MGLGVMRVNILHGRNRQRWTGAWLIGEAQRKLCTWCGAQTVREREPGGKNRSPQGLFGCIKDPLPQPGALRSP